MSTITQCETPARADTSSLNPDALEHFSTAAAENGREKGVINISKETIEHLKSKVKGQMGRPGRSAENK